jgi:hypothetical protein
MSHDQQAPELPEWWRRAVALEKEDKLAEAERVIADAVQHMAFAHVTAELYRDRMFRLRAAGDQSGAEAARQKAKHWIQFYASQATSGGEGAALSVQRERFLKELDRRYG